MDIDNKPTNIWLPPEIWEMVLYYLRSESEMTHFFTGTTFSGHTSLVCKEWKDAMDLDDNNKQRTRKLDNPLLAAARAGDLELLKSLLQTLQWSTAH